jgi:nucleotide-binding universal stress UspA family protein
MPLPSVNGFVELKTVIFATDFSLCSQNAGLFAARIATHLHAQLIVAHAFTLTQAAMEVEIDPMLVSQQRKDLQFLLARKTFQLAPESSNATSALLEGEPKDVLPRLADSHQPALIVLGTHGGGWMQRSVIGSVAEQILRSTVWPALTVGPQVAPASNNSVLFKRILYATDSTPAAAGAARYALFLARAFEARIDVLNVVEQGEIKHPDRLSDLTKDIYGALDAVVPGNAREFCDSRTFVEVGNAHLTILRHIQERSIDLLLLGIRKTSHLGLEMRTSGAFQLIVDATCPVVTITA